MSTSTTTTEELLARLEALAARLAEQGVQIAEQRAEIARLRAERPAPTAAAAPAGAKRMTDRRGLLRGLLAAGAALAALGAGRARPAHADFSGTGPAFGSTANYGLVASYGATSASQSLPALSTRHGVIGTDSNLSPSPPAGFDSGVLGLSNFDIGVQGLSNYKEGVRGRSGLYSTAGVFGENGSPGFENVLEVRPKSRLWFFRRARRRA